MCGLSLCSHLVSLSQLGATPAQYDSAVAALRYRASVPQLPPSLNDGDDAMDDEEDEDEDEDEDEASREARVFAEEGDELYARSDHHRHSSHRQSGGGGANSVDVVVLLDDDDVPPAQARVQQMRQS